MLLCGPPHHAYHHVWLDIHFSSVIWKNMHLLKASVFSGWRAGGQVYMGEFSLSRGHQETLCWHYSVSSCPLQIMFILGLPNWCSLTLSFPCGKSGKLTNVWKLNNTCLNNQWVKEEIRNEMMKIKIQHTETYGMQLKPPTYRIHVHGYSFCLLHLIRCLIYLTNT